MAAILCAFSAGVSGDLHEDTVTSCAEATERFAIGILGAKTAGVSEADAHTAKERHLNDVEKKEPYNLPINRATIHTFIHAMYSADQKLVAIATEEIMADCVAFEYDRALRLAHRRRNAA